jgi:hypothetical protein
MKGRVIEPKINGEYFYIDLLADDPVTSYLFSGNTLDYDLQNRHLIFHDYATARKVADHAIEYIKTITN